MTNQFRSIQKSIIDGNTMEKIRVGSPVDIETPAVDAKEFYNLIGE